MPAFYRNRFTDFQSDDIGLIVGCLTQEAASAGYYQQVHAQTEAWQVQIRVLKDSAQHLQCRLSLPAWQILLEYLRSDSTSLTPEGLSPATTSLH
jgi:hypothetical protein